MTAHDCRAAFDVESDGDLDMRDFVAFQQILAAP